MPLVPSEYACPRCKSEGKTSQIFANLGQLVCQVNSTHSWVDTPSFFAENPKMEFKVEVPKNLPQQGHSPMTVSLPVGMEAALSAKYADKVSATVASILQQMLEGSVLIIGQTDYDRLAGHLGKNPESAGELVGMVYSLKEDATTQKAIADDAARDLKAYEGLSIGRLVVDLGDQYQNAVDKARGAELPLKLFVERSFKHGLENGWF